jgi:hypothetical protein
MHRKISAVVLSLLVAGTTALLAHDDKDKRGKKHGRHDDEREKVERHERDDDEHERDERRAVIVQPVNASRIARINMDVNRLESLLATAQNSTVVFAKPTLTRVANEANSLANRIFANTRKIRRADAAATARSLRMHVREMHAAAAMGDAPAVRVHAGQALSLAVRLDGMV